jgi:ribonuclease D
MEKLPTNDYIDLDFLNFNYSDITHIQSSASQIDILKSAFDELEKSEIVGLDSEWVKQHRPIKSLLIQIATREKAYVIDFVGVGGKSDSGFDKECENLLRRMFENNKVLKVAWDFDLDLKNINNRFNDRLLRVDNFIDLMRYHPSSLEKGFSSSCSHFLGRKLDKTCQTCDWSNRPLSKEKIIYAAIDSIASIALYDKMKKTKTFIPTYLLLKDVNKRMEEFRRKREKEEYQRFIHDFEELGI